MSNSTNLRTLETQNELSDAGLGSVTADVDEANTCYLTGSVDSIDQEAEAVAIAFAHGADLVCDGMDAPGQSMPDLERHHAAGAQHHHENMGKTAGQKILGGADLSSRLFDSSSHDLQTGNPLVTGSK